MGSVYERIDQKSVITTLLAAGVVAATAFFVYRKRKDAKSKHSEDKLEDRMGVFYFLSLEPAKSEKECSSVEEKEKAEEKEKKSIPAEDSTNLNEKAKPASEPAAQPSEEAKPETAPPAQPEAKASEKKPARKTPEWVSLYNKAKTEFNAGKYEEALALFTQAIDSSPSGNAQLKTLIYSRASCLKKLNRIEESLSEYTKCIELDPKYRRAYMARAGLYKAQGDLENSLRDFSFEYLLETIEAGDLQPTPQDFEAVVQELAARHCQDEIDRRYASSFAFSLPSAQFMKLYFLTLRSERAAQYNTLKLSEEELSKRIEAGAEAEPSLGDLYLMRGGLRKSKGAFEAAYADFCEAAKEEAKCSDRSHALLEKATFLTLSGDQKEARKIFEALFDEGMREVNLLVKFASCLLELGDETRAHALFDEAVSANPKEVDAWFHRGQMRLIEGDLKRAKEDLQRVAKLNPNHEMAFVQLGFCFAQEQRFDMAIENMKRAVSCQDCPAAVFVHYGEMMNMMTRLGEAEELFKKAIEKDRTWPYSYVNLATLELQARNDYLKAFEYLEKAIQVDGTCVAAFVQRAQLYMLMQENAKASEDLEKAMAQCRTSSDLKQVCGMKISLQFQTEALEKFQQLTKAEAV